MVRQSNHSVPEISELKLRRVEKSILNENENDKYMLAYHFHVFDDRTIFIEMPNKRFVHFTPARIIIIEYELDEAKFSVQITNFFVRFFGK